VLRVIVLAVAALLAVSTNAERFQEKSRHLISDSGNDFMAQAQDPKGQPVSVHVKEVHRGDKESNEEGAWIHITATAESKTIVYSLKCDEFYSYKKGDYAIKCFSLTAGQDYSGVRGSPVAALNFWKPENYHKGYALAAYTIVSEKEK
jgi:hypothetical protein